MLQIFYYIKDVKLSIFIARNIMNMKIKVNIETNKAAVL